MQETLRTHRMESGTGTFLFGVLCGAAVGAALGLMFAPKPGSEMRQQLADRTERLRRRASEQAGRLRERASQMYGGASDTFSDAVARGREAISAGREAFQQSRPHDGQAADAAETP